MYFSPLCTNVRMCKKPIRSPRSVLKIKKTLMRIGISPFLGNKNQSICREIAPDILLTKRLGRRLHETCPQEQKGRKEGRSGEWAHFNIICSSHFLEHSEVVSCKIVPRIIFNLVEGLLGLYFIISRGPLLKLRIGKTVYLE